MYDDKNKKKQQQQRQCLSNTTGKKINVSVYRNNMNVNVVQSKLDQRSTRTHRPKPWTDKIKNKFNCH